MAEMRAMIFFYCINGGGRGGAQRGRFNVSFMDIAGVRWGARGRSWGGGGAGAEGGGVAAKRQPALAESQKKIFPSVTAPAVSV